MTDINQTHPGPGGHAWTPDDDRPPLVTQLSMIEHYAASARAAVIDEHEGNARYYVGQLAGLANQVAATLEAM